MTPEQQAALVGAGTALTGTVIDPNGQTFGGGKSLDQWLTTFNQQFPDAHAHAVQQTSSEGSPMGETVAYDTKGLPAGWDTALTGKNGGVEVSDPNSHWGQNRGSGDGTFIDPSAVHNVDGWGDYTGASNIKDVNSGVGVWGPLAVSAVIGGAGAGLLGGFGGMTDAAAQGLVSGATGSMAGADAAATLGTGAMDIGGSTGTGIPGSEGAQSGSWFDNLASKFNPQNAIADLQKNVQDPSWWLKEAGKQGMSQLRRQAAAQALRQRQQTGG